MSDLSAEQEALFSRNLSWAESLGSRIAESMREDGVHLRDELIQAARVGLFDAVQACTNMTTFRRYAARRIIGRCYDEINLVTRSHHRRGTFVQMMEPIADGTPAQQAEERDTREHLMRLVWDLPYHRDVVRLFAQGYTQVEIGQRLGLTANWVKLIRQRVRAEAQRRARAMGFKGGAK